MIETLETCLIKLRIWYSKLECSPGWNGYIEALYTSIPQEWGILVVLHLENKYPQNEFIIELLDLALKHNYFQFLGNSYQQLLGTSMGAP